MDEALKDPRACEIDMSRRRYMLGIHKLLARSSR
jgi:hypothetical protein